MLRGNCDFVYIFFDLRIDFLSVLGYNTDRESYIKNTEVLMEKFDVAVIGGGISGLAAAVASARQGSKTILIEKSGALGGAMNLSLVLPFMRNRTLIDGKSVRLSQGIFAEICKTATEIIQECEGVDIDPESFRYYNEEYMKLAFNRIAQKYGVTLLFHSYMTGMTAEGGKISSVTLSSRSGNFDISAKIFVDATGDASLAYLAGCPYRLGRDDGLCQPMTLCFRVGGVDREVISTLPSRMKAINELYSKFQSEGKIKNPRENVLVFKTIVDGCLHFNSTRVIKLNPTDPFDLSKAEIEAREQTLELFLFMKNNIEGFENAQLLMTACEIGVRESRMIDGEYILTGDDLKNLKKFPDSIAFGNYDIDIHNPEGSGTSHYFFAPGEYYSIPYRSLIPKKISNLLVAGRCISVDHDAQASIRIMPIVCTLGEAAGTAASLCVSDSCSPTELDVCKLRRMLRENGALC